MARSLARGLTVLAIGGVATFGALAPADAAPRCTVYPPGATPSTATVTCTGTGAVLSVQVVPVGKNTKVIVTVAGFGKNKRVTFVLHSAPVTVGTLVTNSQGVAAGPITIPSNIPAGNHTLVATGEGPNGNIISFSIPLTVAAAGSGKGGLPFTGFEVGVASLLGVGLVGAGTVSVLAGRKKKELTPA